MPLQIFFFSRGVNREAAGGGLAFIISKFHKGTCLMRAETRTILFYLTDINDFGKGGMVYVFVERHKIYSLSVLFGVYKWESRLLVLLVLLCNRLALLWFLRCLFWHKAGIMLLQFI